MPYLDSVRVRHTYGDRDYMATLATLATRYTEARLAKASVLRITVASTVLLATPLATRVPKTPPKESITDNITPDWCWISQGTY